MITSQNQKAVLYTISNDYIKRLKEVEYRVQNNYNGQRLYYKTDFKASALEDDCSYYVPLSSAKESQKNIDNKSLFKIYGDKDQEDFLGVLHINNMIPVPNSLATEWSPDDKQDTRYTTLVVKQSKYIGKNEKKITRCCEILYNSKVGNVEPDYFKKNRTEVMLYKRIVNDVGKLERVCNQEKELVRQRGIGIHFDME